MPPYARSGVPARRLFDERAETIEREVRTLESA
jgi:hypothetical protein